MKTAITTLLFLLIGSSSAFASLSGTYSANFLTGTSGGGAFSYIHTATSHGMTGAAGYEQKAGGDVLFAVDNRSTFTMTFTDNGIEDQLDELDTIDFMMTVNLLEFDGSLDGTNTNLDVIGSLTVEGRLQVGSTTDQHSPDFTNALANIWSPDQNAIGMQYGINLIDSVGSFAAGTRFRGGAFFQQANFTGPFNGISYNETTESLEFALWGDSRNTTNNNTGRRLPANNELPPEAHALGFDFRVSAVRSAVPEPTTIMTWSVLLMGMAGFRRRKQAA